MAVYKPRNHIKRKVDNGYIQLSIKDQKRITVWVKKHFGEERMHVFPAWFSNQTSEVRLLMCLMFGLSNDWCKYLCDIDLNEWNELLLEEKNSN